MDRRGDLLSVRFLGDVVIAHLTWGIDVRRTLSAADNRRSRDGMIRVPEVYSLISAGNQNVPSEPVLAFVKLTSALQDPSVVRSRSEVMYPAMVHHKIHSRRAGGGILNCCNSRISQNAIPIMSTCL